MVTRLREGGEVMCPSESEIFSYGVLEFRVGDLIVRIDSIVVMVSIGPDGFATSVGCWGNPRCSSPLQRKSIRTAVIRGERIVR